MSKNQKNKNQKFEAPASKKKGAKPARVEPQVEPQVEPPQVEDAIFVTEPVVESAVTKSIVDTLAAQAPYTNGAGLLDQILNQTVVEEPEPVEAPVAPARHFNFDDAPPVTLEDALIENAQLRAALQVVTAELNLYKGKVVRTPKAKQPGDKTPVDRSEAAKKSWETIRANRAAKAAAEAAAKAEDKTQAA